MWGLFACTWNTCGTSRTSWSAWPGLLLRTLRGSYCRIRLFFLKGAVQSCPTIFCKGCRRLLRRQCSREGRAAHCSSRGAPSHCISARTYSVPGPTGWCCPWCPPWWILYWPSIPLKAACRSPNAGSAWLQENFGFDYSYSQLRKAGSWAALRFSLSARRAQAGWCMPFSFLGPDLSACATLPYPASAQASQ